MTSGVRPLSICKTLMHSGYGRAQNCRNENRINVRFCFVLKRQLHILKSFQRWEGRPEEESEMKASSNLPAMMQVKIKWNNVFKF